MRPLRVALITAHRGVVGASTVPENALVTYPDKTRIRSETYETHCVTPRAVPASQLRQLWTQIVEA